MKVSVSFLTSENIKEDLLKLDKTSTDYVHVDVMDGKFVSNANDPYDNLKNFSLEKKLDVHLMVEDPIGYIEKYAKLDPEYITIHHEIDKDVMILLDKIKSFDIKCGISINPDTDINVLKQYLDKVDLILIMSVVPGKGGQKFIESTPNKINQVRKMINEANRDIFICVDGGINNETICHVHNADVVVSGSYVLNSDNYQEQIQSLM